MDFVWLEKAISIVGRENLTIVLAFFLLKRLINGLIPTIEAYIAVRIDFLNYRMSGRKTRRKVDIKKHEGENTL